MDEPIRILYKFNNPARTSAGHEILTTKDQRGRR
jgi:hypothetical protein